MLISSLVPVVASIAPAAPDVLIERMLRDSARTFCHMSKVWRTELDPIVLTPEVDEYEAVLPAPAGGAASDTVIAEIITSWILNENAERTTLQRIGYSDMERVETIYGHSRYIIQTSDKKVRLVPPPAQADTLVLSVALAPSRAATALDDWLVSEFEEGITSGAVKELLAMPGTLWHNPQLSAYYAAKQSFSLQAAENRGDRSRSTTIRVVKYGGLV